jgi:hypothetical protein
LQYILILIMGYGLGKYLMISSQKKLSLNSEGVIVLRVNKINCIIGIIGIIFGVMLGFIIQEFHMVKDDRDLMLAICLISFFMLSGISLILMWKNQRVEIKKKSIKYYDMRGKVKVILWEDINFVKFNRIGLNLVLVTNENKVKINLNLIGFQSFVEIMKQRLGKDLYEIPMSKVERVQNFY